MEVSPARSTCVCTTLRMASRVVTRHYDRALAPAGLRAGGYAILSRAGTEGPLPLGALAARLAMDRTTLSRELEPLAAAGLLDVRPDERDARKRVVALTPAGVARVAEARPFWAEAQRELENGLGAERTGLLRSELQALIGAA